MKNEMSELKLLGALAHPFSNSNMFSEARSFLVLSVLARTFFVPSGLLSSKSPPTKQRTCTMKSPLKASPTLLQPSTLKQANSLGSGSFLNEEELDTLFGRNNPFKKSSSSSDPLWDLPSGKSNNKTTYSSNLKEWSSFASFDPINTSTSSNSTPLLHKKRVQWREDENGDVECQEFAAVQQDFELIRSQWYDASSFRQFRAACHEMSLKASLDPDYTETFRRQLAVARRGQQPTLVELEVLEFSQYRGLERAVFRQELQSHKYSAIAATVAQQDDAFMNSVEHLGETSRQWTAAARQMARTLALEDYIIAQHAYNDNDSARRFIEI